MTYKKTRLFFVLFITILSITTSVPCQENKRFTNTQLNKLLDDAENNFSKITTIKTMLTQTKKLSIFSEIIISKGFCIFKAPDKLRLEYTEPFKSSLIINKDQIYQYEFYNGKWQKLNSANKEIMLIMMENITSWLKGKFKESEVYDIAAFNNGNITILLIPKQDEFKKFIKSFELGLNRQINGLDYIIINETKNDFTKITFHNDLINQTVSDIVFSGKKDGPQPVQKW